MSSVTCASQEEVERKAAMAEVILRKLGSGKLTTKLEREARLLEMQWEFREDKKVADVGQLTGGLFEEVRSKSLDH